MKPSSKQQISEASSLVEKLRGKLTKQVWNAVLLSKDAANATGWRDRLKEDVAEVVEHLALEIVKAYAARFAGLTVRGKGWRPDKVAEIVGIDKKEMQGLCRKRNEVAHPIEKKRTMREPLSDDLIYEDDDVNPKVFCTKIRNRIDSAFCIVNRALPKLFSICAQGQETQISEITVTIREDFQDNVEEAIRNVLELALQRELSEDSGCFADVLNVPRLELDKARVRFELICIADALLTEPKRRLNILPALFQQVLQWTNSLRVQWNEFAGPMPERAILIHLQLVKEHDLAMNGPRLVPPLAANVDFWQNFGAKSRVLKAALSDHFGRLIDVIGGQKLDNSLCTVLLKEWIQGRGIEDVQIEDLRKAIVLGRFAHTVCESARVQIERMLEVNKNESLREWYSNVVRIAQVYESATRATD